MIVKPYITRIDRLSVVIVFIYFREHTVETENTRIIRQQTGRGSIRRPAPTKSSQLRRKVSYKSSLTNSIAILLKKFNISNVTVYPISYNSPV